MTPIDYLLSTASPLYVIDKHNRDAGNLKYTVWGFLQNFTSDIHITYDY